MKPGLHPAHGTMAILCWEKKKVNFHSPLCPGESKAL